MNAMLRFPSDDLLLRRRPIVATDVLIAWTDAAAFAGEHARTHDEFRAAFVGALAANLRVLISTGIEDIRSPDLIEILNSHEPKVAGSGLESHGPFAASDADRVVPSEDVGAFTNPENAT